MFLFFMFLFVLSFVTKTARRVKTYHCGSREVIRQMECQTKKCAKSDAFIYLI